MAPTGKDAGLGAPYGQWGRLRAPDDPAVAAVSDAVVAALDADREAMVDAVIDTMHRTVSSYAALHAADRRVVRDGVRLTVGQFVDLLRERRRLSPAELARIEALGGVRAAQGVTLDDVLAAVRAAMTGGWSHILSLVPVDAPGDAVLAAVGRMADEVFQYMQQCAASMTKGYTSHQRTGLAQRVQAQDEAVEELLSGLFDADDDVHLRAGAIGIDLTRPHGLLLLAGPNGGGDATEPLRRAKDRLLQVLPGAHGGALRTAPTLHAVVLVPAATPSDWTGATAEAVDAAGAEGLLVLAVAPTRGAGVVHAAYTEAARLIRIARHVADVPSVVRPEDLTVYRFLDAVGPHEGRAFVDRVLGPLFHQPAQLRAKLLDALRAHARSGAMSDAARRLGVHPKTVSYRLRRVREITGLDPDRPLDRLQLDAASLLLELHPVD